MRFTKMNGAGNDFLVIDNRALSLSPEELSATAVKLCNRQFCLGADGMIVIENAWGQGDYRMTFYNRDGSLGEMCGNGARCVCRWGYENGLAGETQRVETTAGMVTGQRIDATHYRIRLNDVTVLTPMDGLTYVELGNPGIPHAVVNLPGFRNLPESELFALGRKLRYDSRFPRGANVNFYEWTGKNAIAARTWERGVEDFTLACGTGAGSLCAALTSAGLTDGPLTVRMPGGTLTVEAVSVNGRVKELYLTGPAMLVASGEIYPDEIQ